MNLRQILLRLVSPLLNDKKYLDPAVPMSDLASHDQWLAHLASIANKEGARILEVGSREVTGKSRARSLFSKAEYVGFDFYPGDNVDVVGDAHRLSEYFPEQKFDVIYTTACFEHFAMPWLVAAEMIKLLKVGGIIFVETHFSFSSHERPWHFFQFSDMGLRVLFPPAAGIECIEAGMSNPIVGRFSSLAATRMRYKKVRGLYCHSEFLGRKTREVDDFSWDRVNLEDVVNNTKYPSPRET